VDLDVPVEVVRARLGARRVCADCGTVTSVDAEAADRRCVPCGGRLQRRSDDHPTAITRRLALFDEQSGPLRAWLRSLGILVRVDGEGDLDDVHERIFAAVAQRIPAVRALVR
jgi:adenylate kinase